MWAAATVANVVAAAWTPALVQETVMPQSFGAIGDGKHNDTAAIHAAVSHCAALRGCNLLFENGTFLTGPFELPGSHSRLVVSPSATVRALPMLKWKEAGWKPRAFVSAAGMWKRLNDVSISGSGTIDGNGASWWAVTHDDKSYRPHMLSIEKVSGLEIAGLTFLNSPNHNIFLDDCDGVRVHGINVEAPKDSPNTDGINFSGGQDQSIVDSRISNGDDCVSIVCSGGDEEKMGYGGNVLVRNVTCEHGHGVSVGSIRHGTVTNVTVENVTFVGSDNGARLKAYPNNTGSVSGIVYRNISMDGVANPILIDGKYCPKSQTPYPCPPGAHAVEFSGITFEGIAGTGSSADGVVGRFDCDSVAPCHNITLRDIQLTLQHNKSSDTTHSSRSSSSSSNNNNNNNNNRESNDSSAKQPQFWCSNITGPKAVNVAPKSCIAPDPHTASSSSS